MRGRIAKDQESSHGEELEKDFRSLLLTLHGLKHLGFTSYMLDVATLGMN